MGCHQGSDQSARSGVSFEEATTVSADPPAIFMADPDHSVDEERYVLLVELVELRNIALESNNPVFMWEIPQLEGSKMTRYITHLVVLTLLCLFIGCAEGTEGYRDLMMKAQALSSEQATGLRAVDPLKQNIRERADLVDEVDGALTQGRITRDQYDRIMTEIRRSPIDKQN